MLQQIFLQHITQIQVNYSSQSEMKWSKKTPKLALKTHTNYKSKEDLMNNKFKMHEIEQALLALDPKKAPGPDGIYGYMMVNLSKIARERYLELVNLSWVTGKVPKDWKTAIVVPIKKPSKPAEEVKSYRPISLTS